VFHVAGDTSFWNKRYALQRKINIDGAVNVANACLKQGVKRLVHTSTLDVFGFNPTGGSYDEVSGRYNFYDMGYNYGDSKYEADVRLRAYNSDKLEVVFVHPGFMIGPYDHTLQIGRVFFELKNKSLPGLLPGGGSYCHVREVAKAHIRAAEKGRPGESYLCAGMPHTNIPHEEMFRKMAKAIKVKPPGLVIPRFAFVAYGYLCKFISKFTNKAPDINPGQARYMSSPQYAISGKAINQLDYHVPRIEDCIEDALTWYRQNGYDI
jgi:dihydroflavonol-4-reductase